MIKSICFIALFSFLNIHLALAQTAFKSETDANNAKQQLQDLPANAVKAKLLLNLAGWYVLQEQDSFAIMGSEQYAKQSLTISNKLNDKHAVAAAYLLLSHIYQIKHDYQKGIAYAVNAANLFESLKDKDQAGEAYVMLWSNSCLSGSISLPQRIVLLQKAADAFHISGNKFREADCLKEAADVYQILGQFIPSINNLRIALRLYQQAGNKRLQATYDLLGSVSILMGNYNDGIKYGLMAVQTAENLNDTTLSLCTYYNRLGMAYVRIKDMVHAKKYLDQALVVAKKYDDLDGIFNVTYNISHVLLWSDKPKEGLDLINALMKKYPIIATYRRDEIACLKVPIYQSLKRYKEALPYCAILESAISKEPDSAPFISKGLSRLISFYIETGNLSKALFYTKELAAFSNREGMDGYKQSYNLYQFRVDSAMGNYLSAIKYYQIYASIKDSLLDETKSLQINQLSVQYETEKKDKDILLLQQGAVLQQTNLNHVTWIRNIIFIGAILLFIILLLLFNGYRRKQKTNSILQRQQDVIRHKNDDLRKLVTEKEWLVKEIHHRVKNNLHMVVGLLASQTEFLKSGEALAAITDSQNRVYAMSLIHQKLYQTEELSSTDMPSYIFDLTEYLKDCFSNTSEITLRLDIAAVEFSLAYSVPIGLIINEAVTNAIKYAFPTGKGIIEIGLQHVDATSFLLYIQDNGKGLPDNFDYRQSSSLGLTLIEGLSTDIEGSFNISSHNGTRIEIKFVDEASRNELH